MFETQAEWGEQSVPMDDRFRGYAEQLGLDMTRYDAVYDDPPLWTASVPTATTA